MKRLYRVTARFNDTYIDGDGVTRVGYTRTWHYQDKRAAEHRLNVCQSGLPGVPGDHLGPGRDPLPAAEWVRIEESEPIVWPEVATAGVR